LLSPGQVTFFVVYGWTLCLWLIAELLHRTRKPSHEYEQVSSDIEGPGKQKQEDKLVEDGAANGDHNGPRVAGARTSYSFVKDALSSGLIKCMTFNLDAIYKERLTLKAMSEFGTLMVWYFICDRTPVIPEAGKAYTRDLFIFLFLILTCVAFGSSLQTVKAPVLLNRPQTEEWKGWMQVLFLLYHYFEAREVYNAIRLFIAAYVWMTGFGNFTYYYKTNDFGIGRFSQMLWRLNFLVFFACLVLRNSYMLYYICPMHTIYTIMVYAALGIAPSLNQSHVWVLVKMLLCVVVVYVCWDIKPVFYAIWSPFSWVMGYIDPRKPGDDALYEWFFRSSLDRFIWIYGMLCAYLHPYAAAILTHIDNLPTISKAAARSTIIAACSVALYFYYIHIYSLPKIEYNKVHPYTSWIPITIWIVYRNIAPTLRLHHLRLYGWLGCITLETYISQFHVWMKTTIPDGQPKALLSLVPGYPLLNFAVCTAAYVFISHRLFELTNTLKNSAVPHHDNRLLFRNVVLLLVVGAALYMASYGLMAAFVMRPIGL